MPPHVIVWDLETVPDLRGFAAANDLGGKSDDDVRAAIGDKFPKHIYHSIICIGALIAHRNGDHWATNAIGAPHIAIPRALRASAMSRSVVAPAPRTSWITGITLAAFRAWTVCLRAAATALYVGVAAHRRPS